MYCFAYIHREPPEERVNPRTQIDLLHRSIAEFIELQSQTKTILWSSLYQRATFQNHERPMGSAFVQVHAMADLGETERCLTLAQNLENRNGALQASEPSLALRQNSSLFAVRP